MNTRLLIAVAMGALSPLAQAIDPMVYCEPGAFGALPRPIARRLAALGCRIPQAGPGNSNVVSGHFLSPADTAWAVLCSRAGTSIILVFEGGRGKVRGELAPVADNVFLMLAGGAPCCYSRVLRVASPERILAADRNLGNMPPLPAIDHDGIEDAFEGKGSSIQYFSSGRWREVAGGD